MPWLLNLVINFCLVLILVQMEVDLKRIHDKNSNTSPVILNVHNPDQHGLGYQTLAEILSEATQESSGSDSGSDSEEDSLSPLCPPIPVQELKYVGCYDVWENKSQALIDDALKENSLGSCGGVCKCIPNSREYLVSVRGNWCFSPFLDVFSLVRVNDSYCNIPCPDDAKLTCGGKFTASAYCHINNCDKFTPPEMQDLYGDTLVPEQNGLEPISRNNGTPGFGVDFTFGRKPGESSCGNCSKCGATMTLTPSFSYIPDNTPEICAQFCRRKISYFQSGFVEIRDPKKYALTGWVNKSIVLPVCSCISDLDGVTVVSESEAEYYCDKSCSDGSGCGSDYWKYMFNIYLSGSSYLPDDPTVSYPSTSSSSLSSSSPVTTPPGSEEDESSTPGTSEHDKKTTPKPGECPEEKRCKAIDPCEIHWEECPGETSVGPCPNGAFGTATWKCLPNGQFEGLAPNYTNCVTGWVKEVIDELNGQPESSAHQLLTKIDEKCSLAMNPENSDAQYFGHEIVGILNLVDRVLKHENLTGETELADFEHLTDTVANIGSSILANPRTWRQLSTRKSAESATALIVTLEESGFDLADRAKANDEADYYRKFVSKLVSVGSGVISTAESRILAFQDTGSSIKLPSNWASAVETRNVSSYTGVSLAAGDSVFPSNFSDAIHTQKGLNGRILSFSLMRPAENATKIFFEGEGVQIRIQHDVFAWGDKDRRIVRRRLHFGEKPSAILGTGVCMYWDVEENTWSPKGCKLVESKSMMTHCECSHLTSFAVLFSYYDYVGKSLGLEILTLVLCSLSVISLFATIVIFSIVRGTHGLKTTITKHLAFCLLVGNTLVMLVVDRNYFRMSLGVCTGAAAITHYVFLTAFMWMGIEGYHLYRMMIHVFDSGNRHMTLIRILAYGFPLLVVLITWSTGALLDERPYGGDEFCWLNGNYVFAFMGPVAIVVIGNLIVLFITLRTAYKVQTNSIQTHDKAKSFRAWVRGSFSITVLLGITWVVGYLQMFNSYTSEVAAYLFTILNASQGFLIFFYHCLLNDKVRMAAERRNIPYPTWIPSVTTITQTSSNARASTIKSNGNITLGKKSVLSGSISPGMEKQKLPRIGPLEHLSNPRFRTLEIPGHPTARNLNSLSSGSLYSLDSSGNETIGSQKNLVQQNSKRSY